MVTPRVPSSPHQPAAVAREVLLETPYWIIEHDRRHRVVIFRRTSLPLALTEDLDAGMIAAERILTTLDRATHGALIDTREAPFRSDPEFEQKLLPRLSTVLEGFAKRGVLVRTALGRLQAARFAREGGRSDRFTFVDEQAALQALAVEHR